MKPHAIISLLVAPAVIFVGLASAFQNAAAEPRATQSNAAIPLQSSTPVIVAELFTSQSCSSCPPAEALFSTLADREDLLTIEWHVDYWDKLVHGGSKWKDVYSDKDYTARQRSYNRSIRGTGGVYTPQAIVNGIIEGVGSRPSEVSKLLQDAPALEVPVQIKDATISVGESQNAMEVLFVRLLKQHETNVKGGENKGRKLAGKNIVLDAKVLGQTGTTVTEFNLPSVGAGETCAVLVQSLNHDVGPIVGAAKCG